MYQQVLHIFGGILIGAIILLFISLMDNLYWTVYTSRNNKFTDPENKEYIKVVLKEELFYKIALFLLFSFLSLNVLVKSPLISLLGITYILFLIMNNPDEGKILNISNGFLVLTAALLGASSIFSSNLSLYEALVILGTYSSIRMYTARIYKKFL